MAGLQKQYVQAADSMSSIEHISSLGAIVQGHAGTPGQGEQ